VAYNSFQAAANYVTQALSLLTNAQRSAAIYQSATITKDGSKIINRHNTMAIKAARIAITHLQKGIEKLGGAKKDADEENSW
jgi:hypothetical protein